MDIENLWIVFSLESNMEDKVSKEGSFHMDFGHQLMVNINCRFVGMTFLLLIDVVCVSLLG